jgi:hypothetical protein
MRTKGAHVFHVRGGKVTRFVVYLDRERALADLGLAEYAMSANLDLVRSIHAAWARCQVKTEILQNGSTKPKK